MCYHVVFLFTSVIEAFENISIALFEQDNFTNQTFGGVSVSFRAEKVRTRQCTVLAQCVLLPVLNLVLVIGRLMLTFSSLVAGPSLCHQSLQMVRNLHIHISLVKMGRGPAYYSTIS